MSLSAKISSADSKNPMRPHSLTLIAGAVPDSHTASALFLHMRDCSNSTSLPCSQTMAEWRSSDLSAELSARAATKLRNQKLFCTSRAAVFSTYAIMRLTQDDFVLTSSKLKTTAPF